MPARRDPGSPSWSCRAPRDQSESGTLFLSGLVNWPGITHVAELTRTRTEKGTTTVEVVYLISILPSGQPAPQHLLELSRGHWSIGVIRFAETNESSGMASKEVKKDP